MRNSSLAALSVSFLFGGASLACGGGGAESAGPNILVPASASASTSAAPVAASPSGSTSAEAARSSVVLAQAAVQITDAGTSFNVPAGWTVKSGSGPWTIVAPEGDLAIHVVDTKSADADEAVRHAWSAVTATFSRTLKLSQPRPGRHGWDALRVYEYETSPNEKRWVIARAMQHRGAWTVVAMDGAASTFEKRAGQLRKIIDTLVPEGWKRESFAGKKANKLDAARIDRIKAFVEATRVKAQIPGEAIALVQGGKSVFEGGFGVRDLDKADKVDAKTLFIIASNTKALTTLMLAKLVDQKKIRWDQPAKELYPDFKLGDPTVTSQVLVSHLVCACTGMPRQDLEWLFDFKKQTPKSEMEMLGTFMPTSKFGEVFQYSNSMAAAAGFIGGHVFAPKKELGAAYDEAMSSLVFAPLGMSDTTFDFARAHKANHARGHAIDIDGKTVHSVDELNDSVIPLRPAGGAWSSAHDMAKYVAMELAGGKLPGGKTYIGEEALLARRKPQVAIGEYASYGMALMVDVETGVHLIHHGGDLFGHHSDMFWIPEADTGGVILTNGDGYLVRKAFIRKVLEELYDGAPEAEADANASIAEFLADKAASRKPLARPIDPAVAAKLARHYKNTKIGEIAVSAKGPNVLFDFGGWQSEMASKVNPDGTSSVIALAPEMDDLGFVVADRGGKSALILRDGQHEYVFEADGAPLSAAPPAK
jgi:CubicO group peptidase (beta-lactamase class C family)